jgi:hypothetical protein
MQTTLQRQAAAAVYVDGRPRRGWRERARGGGARGEGEERALRRLHKHQLPLQTLTLTGLCLTTRWLLEKHINNDLHTEPRLRGWLHTGRHSSYTLMHH